MSRVNKLRTGNCTKVDAKNRQSQAESFVMVAGLRLIDESDDSTPGVAASLAVLAIVAAADAACCHRLGKRSRSQDHAQAENFVASVEPNGKAMSKKFGDVIAAKDDSHYGLTLVGPAKAKILVQKANDFVKWSKDVVGS